MKRRACLTMTCTWSGEEGGRASPRRRGRMLVSGACAKSPDALCDRFLFFFSPSTHSLQLYSHISDLSSPRPSHNPNLAPPPNHSIEAMAATPDLYKTYTASVIAAIGPKASPRVKAAFPILIQKLHEAVRRKDFMRRGQLTLRVHFPRSSSRA